MNVLTSSATLEDGMYEGVVRLLGFLSGSRSLTRSHFRRVLENPSFRILVARDTRKASPENFVGMASIFYVEKLGAIVAEIHDVVVDPACRGQHLGRRLMLGLIADARERVEQSGYSITISLTSKPSRIAANQLYLKLGFTLAARHLRKNKQDVGTNLYRMTITPMI